MGSIFAFGFNYITPNWMPCNGQLLSINDYAALFTLLGTTYGGDGVNTFGLPNLQGAIPIGTGNGAGLTQYALGAHGGALNAVTLNSNNIPVHTHTATSTIPVGNGIATNNPTGAYFGNSAENVYAAASSVQMASSTVATSAYGATSPQPLPEIVAPYQVAFYCICVYGIFPQQP